MWESETVLLMLKRSYTHGMKSPPGWESLVRNKQGLDQKEAARNRLLDVSLDNILFFYNFLGTM